MTSARSDAIIRVDEVLDAANALPEPARRLLAAALRERSPRYCWAVEEGGRLTCSHGSPVRTGYEARHPPHAADHEPNGDADYC